MVGRIIESTIDRMQHAVVAAELNHMPPILVLIDKGGIGIVPI